MATITAESRELLDAACFFAKLLKIDGKDFTLSIELEDGEDEDSDKAGACHAYVSDCSYDIIIAKSEKQRGDLSQVDVLAHEMVHVEQYLSGRLIDRGHATTWEGKYFDPISDDDSYWDSPWEIEAFGRTPGLVSRWNLYQKGKYKLKGE